VDGHRHRVPSPTDRGIRAIKRSLAGLAVTAFLQLLIVMVSGSVALLADTIHNVSDCLTAIPLWVAFVVGRRPPTRRYSYGFERAEDLAGLFIVLVIGASAALVAWEAVNRLLHPRPVDHVPWVIVAGLAGFAGARIAAQVFYALGEASTAVKWGIVAIVANVVAAVTLMGPLGHAGLAGASSLGAYVNLLALLLIARRRLGPLGGRALAGSVGRTLLASLPLAGACGLALALWPARASFPLDVAWLAATIVIGAGLFWAASVALGISERLALLKLSPGRARDGLGDG